MVWTKANVPSYESERVTVDILWDQSGGRHLRHNQVIKIDNVIVHSKSFYEDDDFPSCSDERPNSADQWNKFVSSLPNE
jgi:hypothetical protein